MVISVTLGCVTLTPRHYWPSCSSVDLTPPPTLSTVPIASFRTLSYTTTPASLYIHHLQIPNLPTISRAPRAHSAMAGTAAAELKAESHLILVRHHGTLPQLANPTS